MKALIFILFAFAFCENGLSQTYIGIKAQVGLSNPIGAAEKEANLVYDVNGIISHTQQLCLGWQHRKSIFFAHFGLASLGYSSQTTQGFTTTANYPQPGIGLPINLKIRLRFNYFDAGIGYSRLLSKKISISSNIHYLIVHSVLSHAGFTFPNPEVNAPIGYGDFYWYKYTKEDKQFKDFKNGMAASLSFDYEMARRLFFSTSYLIGFKEFNPYNSQPGTRQRLHQNFSLGLEYRFKL